MKSTKFVGTVYVSEILPQIVFFLECRFHVLGFIIIIVAIIHLLNARLNTSIV